MGGTESLPEWRGRLLGSSRHLRVQKTGWKTRGQVTSRWFLNLKREEGKKRIHTPQKRKEKEKKRRSMKPKVRNEPSAVGVTVFSLRGNKSTCLRKSFSSASLSHRVGIKDITETHSNNLTRQKGKSSNSNKEFVTITVYYQVEPRVKAVLL